MKKFKKRYKVGLCLSGGGTRGFAHMGAFKAFEECGIKFDMVAGASAGSLFGAMYASGMSFNEMKLKTQNVQIKDFKNSKLGFLPSSMDRLQEMIKKVIPFRNIEEFKLPFYAVAVDLKTSAEMHFKSGDVAAIVAGSCAIPGIFLPVNYKGMTLIDGGVKNNIPVDVLFANGCDYVVTIDCNSTRGGGTTSKNIFTQFTTSVGIMMANTSKKGLEISDIVISPDMKRFKSLKLIGKDEMIDEGYRSTMEKMTEIKNLFLGKLKKNKK